MIGRPLLAAMLALAALGAAAEARAAEEPRRAEATADALGVQVIVPGGMGSAAGGVAAPPAGSASAPGFSYGEGVVTTGAIESSATATADRRADAVAAASVQGVSLFGGEITIASVSVRASAGANASVADGSLASSELAGVQILGQAVEPTVNASVALGDWGYAILLEEGLVRESGEAVGFRGVASGLRVHLVADHGGLPAGTEILIGYAEVDVRALTESAASPVSPPAEPLSIPKKPSAPRAQGKRPSREPVPQPPGARPAPPPIVRRPPAGIRPRLTARGYVFPIYGPSSFTDDFAAPRADTGWHHGNDVFAPHGAPVLAAADGELFLVGWNDLGGQRVWLRDDQGNEFYYAHLSAFSPVAFDGSRVRAGDVIGFVGTTGDAVGTPPHLHFEIHPAQLLGLGYDGVVDPYEYLLAWQRLDDASFSRFDWAPTGKAPPPAAVLLDAQDISSAAALDAGELARILAMPDLFGEGRFLQGPVREMNQGA